MKKAIKNIIKNNCGIHDGAKITEYIEDIEAQLKMYRTIANHNYVIAEMYKRRHNEAIEYIKEHKLYEIKEKEETWAWNYTEYINANYKLLDILDFNLIRKNKNENNKKRSKY